MIYETYDKIESFAVSRIKSNEEKPRFVIAYNETIFDKSDIIYLINCIFKKNSNFAFLTILELFYCIII
jgi:hypothetical protein